MPPVQARVACPHQEAAGSSRYCGQKLGSHTSPPKGHPAHNILGPADTGLIYISQVACHVIWRCIHMGRQGVAGGGGRGAHTGAILAPSISWYPAISDEVCVPERTRLTSWSNLIIIVCGRGTLVGITPDVH